MSGSLENEMLEAVGGMVNHAGPGVGEALVAERSDVYRRATKVEVERRREARGASTRLALATDRNGHGHHVGLEPAWISLAGAVGSALRRFSQEGAR